MNITERFNKKYSRHLLTTENYNDVSSLDVYIDTREKKTNRKVIIFWYGGSWIRGTKEIYRFAADAFARASGAVVLVPDYQKYPAMKYPGFIDEAWDVVRWAKDNADTFGASIDDYTVIGHSAGGHTAATVALGYRKPKDLNLPAKCVGLAAPNESVGAGFKVIFGSRQETKEGFPVSIANGLKAALPVKFLLMHGRLDAVVWQSQHSNFVKALRAKDFDVIAKRPWTSHISLILAVGSPFGRVTFAGRSLRRFLSR